MAPAARLKNGRAAAIALYEILSRIPLPPLEQIPDDEQVKPPAGKETDALGDSGHRDHPGSRGQWPTGRRVPVQPRHRCQGGRVLRARARVALCPAGSPEGRARDLRHRRGLDGSARLDRGAAGVAARSARRAGGVEVDRPGADRRLWAWSCGWRIACRSSAASGIRSCGRWRNSRCPPRFSSRHRWRPTSHSSSSI